MARSRCKVAGLAAHAGRNFRVALHRAMGCYLARVPELPGCVGRGATEVEAVEMARSAIRAHLVMARALEGDSAMVELEIRV
jgi:predicted RNase H-like HicB family nuclease